MADRVYSFRGGLVFALLLGACHPKDAGEALPSGRNERDSIHGIGYVEPAGEIRRLAFKHPGIIGEMLVEVGQRVKQGEVLCRMRDQEERVAVVDAEATLKAAKAEFTQIEAGVNPARIAAQAAAKAVAEAEAKFARRELDRQEGEQQAGQEGTEQVRGQRAPGPVVPSLAQQPAAEQEARARADGAAGHRQAQQLPVHSSPRAFARAARNSSSFSFKRISRPRSTGW